MNDPHQSMTCRKANSDGISVIAPVQYAAMEVGPFNCMQPSTVFQASPCLYRLSTTSPHANTPSTFVMVCRLATCSKREEACQSALLRHLHRAGEVLPGSTTCYTRAPHEQRTAVPVSHNLLAAKATYIACKPAWR